MNRMLTLALAGAALAVASPAAAQSFSNNWDSMDFGPAPGFTIIDSYEGWFYDSGDGSGIEVQFNNVAGTPFSGANFVELDSDANIAMSRAIAQAGTYDFSFYYSDRPNVAASSNGLDLMLNGASILSVAGGDGAGDTNWTLYTVRFTALADSTITFSALGTSDSFGGYIDDVALVAVPEPSTWAAMILGIGAVGGTLRRRQAARAALA